MDQQKPSRSRSMSSPITIDQSVRRDKAGEKDAFVTRSAPLEGRLDWLETIESSS